MVLFILTSQGTFGGIPTPDQLPDYKYRPFTKRNGNKHRYSPSDHQYLLLPEEAPLNYYSTKDMRKWYTGHITKVNGWVRLWMLLKIDKENPDYFSDVIIFVTDDRANKKYGKSRIIATLHKRRIVDQNNGETIFCGHDKSYLDSIKEEKPDWRIIETKKINTCRDALDQIIEVITRNAGDDGWITQDIHKFSVA